MRFLTLYFILIFFSFKLSAQRITYYEQFTNNTNEWESQQGLFQTYLKSGKLILENNEDEDLRFIDKILIPDANEVDFDIQAKLQLLKGTPNSKYGLVWSIDKATSRAFFIGLDAAKQIAMYQTSKEQEFGGVYINKNIPQINGYNINNNILIQKRGLYLKILVNDIVAFEGTYRDIIYGQSLGFFADSNTTVAIDELVITEYEMKIDVVADFDSKLKLAKLPKEICQDSTYEKSPILSADGNTLYFVIDIIEGDSLKDQDIWYAKKDNNGNWMPRERMQGALYNEDPNFVISVSPDNNQLLLGGGYKDLSGRYIEGNVFLSHRVYGGWSIPQPIEIINANIKSKYLSYFLAQDNQYLLMSVVREDGFGGQDIYVSKRIDKYTFSEPINLGPIINSIGGEYNPYLATDGKTLYFASNGHLGYGKMDVFVSKRLDNTWTKWSKPQNLGPIINTEANELGVFLSARGEKFYLDRDRDIYEIANTIKQDPVLLVKGAVYDAVTKQPIEADIIYNKYQTHEELGTALGNYETATYNLVLPSGEHYSIMADKPGYYAQILEEVNIENLGDYSEKILNLYLMPINKNEAIRFDNLLFETGKHELKPTHFVELNKLCRIMKDNPSIKIEIEGHTDAVGTEEYNQKLSDNRAIAVMTYLVNRGISKDRLALHGYGEKKFIAPNNTPQNKQKNRRVEIIITQ